MKRWSLFLLAVLAVTSGPQARASTMLFDFGADATPTTGGAALPAVTWNNITTIGTDDAGVSDELLNTEGNPTGMTLQMVSRFNGANENGTTAVSLYPPTATRDSLYGNTEAFGGLENITPIFKLTGLTAGQTYSLSFYASRLGVSDNRETRYTVTGASESSAVLDAANNATNRVQVTAVAPDSSGEITIALTPGANNNNANHFVYLGVLEISVSTGEKILLDFGAAGGITEVVEQPPSVAWNNITATIGSSASGALDGLVLTNGTPTAIHFAMVSRFNGANANGTVQSTLFPVTATQDSLYGNIEAFGGLTNIFPAFKLTGLDTNFSFDLTFYGSRAGVSDNRETRYTVTGQNSGRADLNTANNTNNTVTVTGIRPNVSGEISVALTPGPNNNNANHFTYLGVLKVDFTPVRSPRVLVDFGATGTPTSLATDPDNSWNNVTADLGATDNGVLSALVRTDGSATPINLQMVSRFNGANENGTTTGDVYPVSATRDSLYGNTESFNGLENVTPIFKLTGLNPATAYDLSFYASRLGVGDNRETRYTVSGASDRTVDLNVANNEAESATLSQVLPNSAGEISIALTPGPNNDNANHFVYLGVLQLDWTAGQEPSARPALSLPGYSNGSFHLTLNGTAGKTYKIQRSANFTSWTDAQTVTLTGASQQVEIAAADAHAFYRAVEQ